MARGRTPRILLIAVVVLLVVWWFESAPPRYLEIGEADLAELRRGSKQAILSEQWPD